MLILAFIKQNMMYLLNNWFSEVKWAYQRVVRGYDERAYWDLDEYLAEIILPVLKKFKAQANGCPPGLYDKSLKDPYHKWRHTLDEIIKGFEAHKKIGVIDYQPQDFEKLNKQKLRGLYLFSRYYGDLWS